MNLVEIIHLFSLSVAATCVWLHMNNMHIKTAPKLEIVAWWLLGVGLFGEWFWQAYWLVTDIPYFIAPEHICMSIGMSVLTVLFTQPDWRPILADRRKNRREADGNGANLRRNM